MVYDMLDKAKREEDQVEYCITMKASMFSDFHPTTDIHDIAPTRGRFYADGREVKIDTG